MKQCLGHFLFFLQLRFIYCRGVARIFKGGTHCVKLRVLTSFRHLNIVGCFLKKRFTNGGLRAPQDPPPRSYVLGKQGKLRRQRRSRDTILSLA